MKFTKYLIFLLGAILIAFLCAYIGPWWLIVLGPIIFGFILKLSHTESFMLGALSLLLFWGGLFAYEAGSTGGLIFEKIAYLLPLKGSKSALIIVSLAIIGILGGLAGLNGSYWKRSMQLSK
ncbi:MAG: hypothetical protein KDC25_03575 [Saprospiraceae bacterium]|jgi:hypothetical protein|nr:hypothetical protein [Saprospiraceae bacterium]